MGTFVAVNFVLGSWFTFWFIRGRQVLKPNPLNLKAGGAENLRTKPGSPYSDRVLSSATKATRPRTLNVHFNYSDHMWDAYEVLGVPAGSQWLEVERAYRKNCERTPSGRELLTRAYEAIRKVS